MDRFLTKLFLGLIAVFSIAYTNEITLNLVEVQKLGKHLFFDIEIENDSKDTIYLNEGFSPFDYSFLKADEKPLFSEHGGNFYGGDIESAIPLSPESSMLMQVHLFITRKEKRAEYIKFTGTYFIPVPGKMTKKKLKPLVIEVDL